MYWKSFLFVFFVMLNQSECQNKLLVISIDGLGNNLFNPTYTPNLVWWAKKGLYAEEGVIPVFPSKTFPNHHTISTGLFPADHGIIDNKMAKLNPEKNAVVEFEKDSDDRQWWDPNNNLKPIYKANEMAGSGRKTATIFWPGSKVAYQGQTINSFKPTYVPGLSSTDKIEEVKSLVTGNQHNLIMLYLDNYDVMTHTHGPSSCPSYNELRKIDAELNTLLETITMKNLWNVMIVSDHGFRLLEPSKAVLAADMFKNIDTNDYKIITRGALVYVIPKRFSNEDDFERKCALLKTKIYENRIVQGQNNDQERFNVYRKAEIPSDYKYTSQDRLGCVLVVMKPGFYLPKERTQRLGDHGWFEKQDKEMRGIFVALGPSFSAKTKITETSVQHLYSLMCHVLDINGYCHPNDGDTNDFRDYLTKKPDIANRF